MGELSSEYLSYKTVTKLAIEVPLEVATPIVSFCPRYLDIFDYSRYNKDMNTSIEPNLLRLSKIIHLQSLFTIADIFNYTPPIAHMFATCYIRQQHSYSYDTHRGQDCHSVFKVEKFYHQEFVCFMFTVKNLDRVHFKKSAFAINFPGVFYIVELNLDLFGQVNFIKAIINRSFLPERSSAFAPVFIRKFPSKRDAKFNYFRINYYMVTQIRLPYPYSTDCIDYSKQFGLKSSDNCFNLCLYNKTVARFDLVPFSTVNLDPVNLKHINYYHFQNMTFRSLYHSTEMECEEKCRRLDCNATYSVTQVISEPFEKYFRFSADTPRESSFLIVYSPQVDMNEFLVFLLSCMGSW